MREINVASAPHPRPEPPSNQAAAAGRPRTPRPSLGTDLAGRRRPGVVLVVVFALLLVAISIAGLPYYLAPVSERVRSPFHPWLKPAGYIGQSAGLLAVAIFLVLWLYPLRKRARWLAWTGSVARWLDVHVLAALVLPLLVAVHSAWRFEGLIGLGFWSMMVVWASGVVGRYVYARIPRSKAGIELTLEEIAARRKQLLGQIATNTGLAVDLVERTLAVDRSPDSRPGILGTFFRFVRDDWARRRGARRLRRLYRRNGLQRRRQDRLALTITLRLARREMALTQQAHMLDATHAVFRFWHVLHRPVAIAALVAVLVHVAVVVALGATWLW
jgi:hypothetical protein